jgi:hypothetical protein
VWVLSSSRPHKYPPLPSSGPLPNLHTFLPLFTSLSPHLLLLVNGAVTMLQQHLQQQQHLIPHALSADPAYRLLPPPSSSSFTFNSGQLTPPPTSQMDTTSAYRPSKAAADMRFPVRPQGPVSQASSFPYYVKQPSTSTTRSPLALSTLVMPDPPETRKSPAGSTSSSVAPGLQLPSWIHAPQSSLPQLAAEVGLHPQ